MCGAADMSGNVDEWCSTKYLDNYEDYERNVDDGLEGAERCVLRGGAFYRREFDVRCALRYWNFPVYRGYGVGLRVVAPGSGR